MILVMLETFGAQVNSILKAFVHIHELVFGAVVSGLSRVNLSVYAGHDLSACETCVRVAYAIHWAQ